MEQYGDCWPMLLLYSLSAWGLMGRLCQSQLRGFAHSSFSSCSSSASTYMSTNTEMELKKYGNVAPVGCCKNTCIPSSLCTSLTRGWWRGSLHSSACCCFFTMDLQYDCSPATCWTKQVLQHQNWGHHFWGLSVKNVNFEACCLSTGNYTPLNTSICSAMV